MTTPSVRWMVRRDLPAALWLDAATYNPPWSEAEYLHHLRRRECVGMVAERGDDVVGCMMYRLHKHHLELLRMVAHPNDEAAIPALIHKLIRKLSAHRRVRVLADLDLADPLLAALRAEGFEATHYDRSTDTVRLAGYSPVPNKEYDPCSNSISSQA